MTKIYLDNPDKFGGETYTILDPESRVYLPRSSELTREIVDRMKTGEYVFSLLPQHPAYDKFMLKRSVVRVVDDGKTIFRGDVTKIDTDRYGTLKATCQADLKWLADIPDVFSKIAKSETRYYIGSEAGVVMQWMRKTDKTVDGQDVYEHYPRNNYISLRYIWDDFGFRPSDYTPDDSSRKFTVEIANDTDTQKLQIPMQEAQIERTGGLSVKVLYLGNIHVAPAPKETDPQTLAPYDFDPEEVDMPTGEIVYDEKTASDRTLDSLDFCIVHYFDPLKKDEITAGNVLYDGRNVSHLYIAETPQTQGNKIAWACSATSHTTVAAMVNSVFNPSDAETQWGYNRIVGKERRIYRGDIRIDGELDYSDVDTIFSNLSKWLQTTGGYASVRYADDNAYLDLLPDSGEKDDSFLVTLGENVSDYNRSEDVLALYTGICPRGTYSDRDSFSLIGQTVDIQYPEFEFDTQTGMIFHKEAKRRYGAVVKYQEYDLDRTADTARIQTVYDWAIRDLKSLLEAFISYEIAAYDTRLIGETGAAAVLGNYYKVNIPLFGCDLWLPLTKIKENHLKPSANRYTLGDRRAVLSDYVAKENKK